MRVRLDQDAYVRRLALGAIGAALIRLGYALRPTIKEIP